jgi:hypothetical protein
MMNTFLKNQKNCFFFLMACISNKKNNYEIFKNKKINYQSQQLVKFLDWCFFRRHGK